jgi:uncharacterized damage-inducible protein DinB
MAESFRFSQFVMNLVLPDTKNEDALRRLRDSEGPSISWVTGHLCHYRYRILNLLGVDEASPYGRFEDGARDASDYPDIAELLDAWNGTHEKIESVLESVTDDKLLAKLPVAGNPHNEKTILESVAFYVWHEAYHIGQLGTIRVHYGYRPTAALAVAASQGS